MSVWLIVAAGGAFLCLVGFLQLYRRYKSGRVNLLSLIAYAVGAVSLATYAMLNAFRPDIMTGQMGLLTLLPAIAAIAVIVHYHGRPCKKQEMGS